MAKAKKKASVTIERAVGALLQDFDRRLCARPTHWRGSAEALVLHAGNLYRVAPGLEPLSGPAHAIDATMIVAPWETLDVVDVLRETDEPADPAPASERASRRKRQEQPAEPRRDKRGRPSAAELREALPAEERDAWIGVAEAATLAGTSRDRIRRAVAAGALAARTIRNVTFVEANAVRSWIEAGRVGGIQETPSAASEPALGLEPAAPAPTPAPADVDPFEETFS